MAKETLTVVAGVVERGGKFLITRRHRHAAHLAGAWEFPGGKLEPDEDPRDALARELDEEIGVRPRVGEVADVAFYRYPERNILLIFYRCGLSGAAEPYPRDCAAVKWIEAHEFPQYRFPPADTAVIAKIRALGKTA
jgi:8-oxo-dGTP diphosphatase